MPGISLENYEVGSIVGTGLKNSKSNN